MSTTQPEESTKLPLVTVITPSYNRADLLPQTIESVLNQDYENFEYLVLDDGSKDHTSEIIKQYEDPRLRYLYHDNMGVIRTVNKGFELAQGEFITVVNSDDPLLPGYISQMVAFLQANPEVIGAYPDWVMIDKDSNQISQVVVNEYDYLNSLRAYLCYQGPGTMFRRDIFKIVEPYDVSFPTFFDYEFYMRVGMHRDFKRLPKTLATYRSHDGTLTSQASGKIGSEYLDVMEKLYRMPDMPKAGHAIKRQVFASAHYLTGMMMRPDFEKATSHFIRSIVLCPIGCKPNNLPRNWKLMLNIILNTVLPGSLIKLIKMISSKLRPENSAH